MGKKTAVIVKERALAYRFAPLPLPVLFAKSLSPGAKVMYAAVINKIWSNIENCCFPTQNQLAQELGISDRQVRNLLQELKDAKLLAWTSVPLETNVYYLLEFPAEMLARFSELDPLAATLSKRKDPSTSKRKDPSVPKRKNTSAPRGNILPTSNNHNKQAKEGAASGRGKGLRYKTSGASPSRTTKTIPRSIAGVAVDTKLQKKIATFRVTQIPSWEIGDVEIFWYVTWEETYSDIVTVRWPARCRQRISTKQLLAELGGERLSEYLKYLFAYWPALRSRIQKLEEYPNIVQAHSFRSTLLPLASSGKPPRKGKVAGSQFDLNDSGEEGW